MLITISKVLLAAAGLVSLWFIVRGLIDMQRINAGDEDVLETQGMVRQLSGDPRGEALAVLTLNVEDEVIHVDCQLPGPWLWGRAHQVTDVVPVLWRRGDKRAVAVQTIRDGQRMFLVGFIALALAAVLFVVLY